MHFVQKSGNFYAKFLDEGLLIYLPCLQHFNTHTHTHTFLTTECQTALIGAGLISPQGTSNNLTVEKDALNMSRFLNRILGLPVKLQSQLFSYFTDTLAAVCQQAKKLGKWDGGIQDFGAQGEHVEVVEMREYMGDPAFCTATTQLVKVGTLS